MLLERFGLWEVRAERVSTFSRGMTQRLALCRALLHDPALLVLDEPYTALDEDGAALLDRELAALAGERTIVLVDARPGARRAARHRRGSRSHERLPLRATWSRSRARTCGSSCARATRCRRCCSSSSRRSSSSTSRSRRAPATMRPTACSGSRSSSRRSSASRAPGRPSGSSGVLDGLVLAPCDRSAIWLGKTLATLAFLGAAELVALPAFALFFAPVDARRGRRRRAREHRDLRRRVAARGDGRREPGARGDPAAPLPPARDPARRRRRRRGRSRPTASDVPLLPRPLRPGLRDTVVGVLRIRRHGITSPSSLAFAAAGLLGARASCSRCSSRPRTPTRASRSGSSTSTSRSP